MTTGYIELKGMTPQAADKYVQTRRRLEQLRETVAEAQEKTVSSLEAFGVGLGIGYAETRFDSLKEPFGIPLAVTVGLGAHLAGLLLPGTEYSSHLNNVGNAGLAVYGCDTGRDFGTRKKQESTQPQGATNAGFQPVPMPGRV